MSRRSGLTESMLSQFSNIDGPKGATKLYRDGWTRTFSKIRCKKCDVGVVAETDLVDGLCEDCRNPPIP